MLLEIMRRPWPWYVAGPLIGLTVPGLLLIGNRMLGISSSFRHVCAALLPARIAYFAYDWKQEAWNLWFVCGIVTGGWLAVHVLGGGGPGSISAGFAAQLASLGIGPGHALLPGELFGWHALGTPRGAVLSIAGGFLVGFGARYAGGCTGGHTVAGIATLQRSSLLATLAFFAGGLLTSWLILPRIVGMQG